MILNWIHTAISLHADIDIPAPSICFRAYVFSSLLKSKTLNNNLYKTKQNKLWELSDQQQSWT